MTTRVFQLLLPAASKARIVTVLIPVNNGTDTDQVLVPEAVPAPPKLLAQVIARTPTLSVAVPVMVTVDVLTVIVAVPGEAI